MTRTLPAPDGPYAVGVTTGELERPAQGGGRRLTVTLWYPASGTDGLPREPLWSAFRERGAPAPLRLLMRTAGDARTHSATGAPIRPGRHSLILYNHGLISIAAENPLLMEALASHGHVVVSVSHTGQMAEYASLRRAMPAAERAADRSLHRRLRHRALTRSERARLTAELYRASAVTPEIVRRRAEDSRFVLDRIGDVLARIPGGAGACADAERSGVLGYSLGGAVATRLCRIDGRCAAAANMDGGLFADPMAAPAPAPYLMLYSAANEGANDALKDISGPSFEEAVAPGATHMDFHDATLVWPWLKLMGALGRASGGDMVRWRNARVREFFDAHLKAAHKEKGAAGAAAFRS